VGYRIQQNKLKEITSLETSTAKELEEAAKKTETERGKKGEFRRQAEVKGVIKCETPLTSEIAKAPCVFCRTIVTREYKETYYETDPRTKQQVAKTRNKTQTLSDSSRMTHFWVEDSTGRVLVNPKGAKLDLEQVADKYEPWTPSILSTITLGNFAFNLGQFLRSPDTLGYRFEEKILPLDRPVYILGAASDSTGQLMIQDPGGISRFIISLKSEEQLVRSTSRSLKFLMIGAAILGLAGLVLLVLGLAK
jgi:hypothetical protein